MRVYIAGPYTGGSVTANVRFAIQAGDAVLKAGHCPYIPHLNHLWDLVCPGSYSQWLNLDLNWLPLCDVLIRLPGKSPGADVEVEVAKSLDIKVHTLEDFLLECAE